LKILKISKNSAKAYLGGGGFVSQNPDLFEKILQFARDFRVKKSKPSPVQSPYKKLLCPDL
jgi:hypothetical protein